jgi:3-methyl-2-oxobutanoate hydroxymethyltransferase
MGGYKVQGRSTSTGAGSAEQIVRDAKALEEAGAFCIVIECVPQDLASTITRELSIPTIGIGAGHACDGQVLVSYDLLGLQCNDHRPKFLKQFAQLGQAAIEALSTYGDEVRSRAFPSAAECYDNVSPRPTLAPESSRLGESADEPMAVA